MAVVPINYLLEAGVHFGHQTKRWNPKMKEYIHTSRDGIYIIDLQKTAKLIEEAYNFLYDVTTNGGKVLFVGTRKQASTAIKEEALRSNSFYVNERWLGGTLTNFKTIRKRIKRLEEIEEMEKDGTFEVLPKKEVVGLQKEYNKLNKVLAGIREMHKLPSAIFIVDPFKEEIAIKEARKLNIPIIGIIDTNCDPDMVDYVIPGNDDAIRAIRLITVVMANAINAATGGNIIEFNYNENRDESDFAIMERALETVNRKDERQGRYDNRNYRRKRKPHSFRQTDKPIYREVKEEKVTKEEKVEKIANEIKEAKEETVKPKAEPSKKDNDLSSLTVAELRKIAKEKEIKGFSTMKKAELIEALD